MTDAALGREEQRPRERRAEGGLLPPRLDPLFAALATGWGLLILFVTTQPARNIPALRLPHMDKIVHFGTYGILAFLIYAAIAPLWRRPLVARPGLLVVGIVAVLGAADEVYQVWRPDRVADIADWLANTLGAVVAVLAAKAIWAWRRSRSW